VEFNVLIVKRCHEIINKATRRALKKVIKNQITAKGSQFSEIQIKLKIKDCNISWGLQINFKSKNNWLKHTKHI
jgi:hypothetical protein